MEWGHPPTNPFFATTESARSTSITSHLAGPAYCGSTGLDHADTVNSLAACYLSLPLSTVFGITVTSEPWSRSTATYPPIERSEMLEVAV